MASGQRFLVSRLLGMQSVSVWRVLLSDCVWLPQSLLSLKRASYVNEKRH